VVLSSVTVLLGFEAVSTAAVVAGIASLASLVGAAIVYFWNIPVAVEDFRQTRI
jgi:hypothetical protein